MRSRVCQGVVNRLSSPHLKAIALVQVHPIRTEPRDSFAPYGERLVETGDARYAWLDVGPDWRCTSPAPQGPVPSCLKHDVAYDSLQILIGLAEERRHRLLHALRGTA